MASKRIQKVCCICSYNQTHRVRKHAQLREHWLTSRERFSWNVGSSSCLRPQPLNMPSTHCAAIVTWLMCGMPSSVGLPAQELKDLQKDPPTSCSAGARCALMLLTRLTDMCAASPIATAGPASRGTAQWMCLALLHAVTKLTMLHPLSINPMAG